MKITIEILLILLLLGNNSLNLAQACCTSGTPLLGSLDLASTPSGLLSLGITFHHNELNDVLNNSNLLESNQRERISQSILLETSYGVSNRFSFSTIFSFIRQQRTIKENNIDKLTAQGLGDLVLIGKYNIIPFSITNPTLLSLGLGIKIPIGKSELKNNEILIPADMHPGSGSWDFLLTALLQKNNLIINDLIFSSSVSYKLNGGYRRFGSQNQSYKFGNELILLTGISYPFESIIDLTLMVKYRNTSNDIFGNSSLPNTGGNWFYFVPNILLHLSNQLSFKISSELPFYRKVNGTQLTTTFTTSLSFYYKIDI